MKYVLNYYYCTDQNDQEAKKDRNKCKKSIFEAQLVVTISQPVCANRFGISRLMIWFIPQFKSVSTIANSSSNPLELESLASVKLNPGQMIACMDVHPSRSRGLIALGFMDGRIDVYLLVR